MKILYHKGFFCILLFFGFISCKLDKPIYPAGATQTSNTGTIGTTGTGTTGTGTTGTGTTGTGTTGTGTIGTGTAGTGTTGTGTTGTGTTGTGTTGTGTTGTGTSTITGDGLPLGATNTIVYKIDGVTTTCKDPQFGVDFGSATHDGDSLITGMTPDDVNLDFKGFAAGTFTMEKLIIGNLIMIPGGKVKVTTFNTNGYGGTLQGTFQADMQDFFTQKIHKNVLGSFNITQ